MVTRWPVWFVQAHRDAVVGVEKWRRTGFGRRELGSEGREQVAWLLLAYSLLFIGWARPMSPRGAAERTAGGAGPGEATP